MDTEIFPERGTSADMSRASSGGYAMSMPILLPAQHKCVELLSHLALYSELLVAVYGPDGSGKTVLARALAAHCEEPESSLLITADMMLGMPAILKSIATHWDMPPLPDDIVRAKEAVKNEAGRQVEKSQTLLVVIDQAEQLDTDTLNEIAHFALLILQAVSFTLFGTTGFEQNFRDSPAAAPLHTLGLEPLNLDDAALLIQQVYSPQHSLPMTQDELLLVYHQSGGWPAALLSHAEDYLLLSHDSSGHKTTESGSEKTASRFPLTHLLAIAAVAAALLLSFLYRDGVSPTDDNAVATAESALAADKYLKNTQDESVPALSAFDGETTDITPPVVASVPDYNYVEDKTTSAVKQRGDGIADAAIPAPDSEHSLPAAAVSESLSVKAEKSAVALERTADERDLLATDAGYIVQLFGSYQLANADAFRQKWLADVSGRLYRYQTEYKGKPWFVVVAGVYGSRAEATAAVNTLPADLRRQSPWVRDITAIHKALR